MINFQFSTLRYRFKALNSFRPPYFLGSAFRGVMGRGLKKTVCIKPFEECSKCEFNRTCPYTVIFETEQFLNQPSKYVMKPPYEKKELKEGDELHLEITLLGETSDYWEFITASFSGVINLGKERYIKLQSVEYLHPFQQEYYPIKNSFSRFDAYHFFELVTRKSSLIVQIYPTSIKVKNSFVKASQFNKDIFVKSVISRVSKVALSYGIKEKKIFIDRDRFDITYSRLHPSPMKRWSNRKGKHMTIPAFEGFAKLEGDLSQIYPLLSLIEVINLGKSVSFGLGRVEIIS
ncbi:MAG: CRISPR system precrRNA processing endoribonuclease RAMP protein Cas6 [Persephonella sp.]|nr:CRISPR system precrRNA processing endoribonuclease RAMP protein Cas6 [Persephonella sp.]